MKIAKLKIVNCNSHKVRLLSVLVFLIVGWFIFFSNTNYASANTIDWICSNAGGSTAWATGTNWSGGVAPANDTTTDVARFNCTSYSYQPNAGTRSVAGIIIGDGSTAVTATTITTTALTIGASGVTVNAAVAGVPTINGAVTLGAGQTWINSSGQVLTITATVNNNGYGLIVDGTGNTTASAVISGVGSVTKNGTGTLQLNTATNTWSGGLIVNAGIASGAVARSFGAVANPITLGDTSGIAPATLQTNGGAIVHAQPITVRSGSSGQKTIQCSSSGNPTFSGQITMNDSLTVASCTTRTLTFSGGTITTSGSGYTLTIANTGTTAITSFTTAAVNHAGTVINSSTTSTANSVSTITGGVGTNVISITNNTTGNTTISTASSSVLTVASGGTTLIDSNATGLLTLSAGTAGTGNLILQNNNTKAAGITVSTTAVNHTGAINITTTGSSGTITFSAAVGNNVTSITNTSAGSGTITFSGGTGTGLTTITQKSTTAAMTFGTAAISVGSGTLTLTNSLGGVPLTITGGISGTGNVVLDNDSALAAGVNITTTALNNTGTVSNIGAGVGSVTIGAAVGANVTTIQENSTTSALTITGAITTTSGTNKIFQNSNSGGSSILTIQGGVTGTGTITFDNDSSIANGITVDTTTNPAINNSNTMTNVGAGSGSVLISGVIGANVTGVVQNTSNDPLILSATNLYAGPTTITSGTLQANATAALGSGVAGNALIFNGGILQATGAITSPPARPITLTQTAIIDTNSYAVSLGGTIGSAGGITKQGAGTLTLAGTTTLGGALTVSAGTVTNSAVVSGTTMSVANGAIFTQGANTLTMSDDVIIGGGTNGTFNGSASAITFGGNLTLNTGAVWNKGAGIITFNSGANTKTITSNATNADFGSITIGDGSLAKVLQLGSAIKVTNIIVTTNATLDQGASYGLTTTGTVTINSNGTWNNTGTGAVTLSGDVSNAGAITLNSNNGTQCTNGTNSIVVTSSSGGTQRDWTGAGTFTIYNVNATDQKSSTSVVTAYNSTLTNTTWAVGSCVATAIYRSVAPGDTSNHNPNNYTVTISGTTATFSGAMPDNIGVGDVLEYPASSPTYVAFISGRTSSTVYTVQSASGGTPTAAAGGTAVNVFRAYTSLYGAESGIQNTSVTPTFYGGGHDLVANNEQWNITLYANGTTADGAVTIDGWTTSTTNYLRIYTATSTSEVGTSQRHLGVFDTSKYYITGSMGGQLLTVVSDYVVVDGLQFHSTGDGGGNTVAFSDSGRTVGYTFDDNIVFSDGASTGGGPAGVIFAYLSGSNSKAYVYNNIIYGYNAGGQGLAFYQNLNNLTGYVYNNTIVNSDVGITHGSSDGTFILKNNLSYNNGVDYTGAYDASSANNLSKDNTSPNSGSTDCGGHSCRGQTVSFVDATNKNFHLSSSDTAAIGAGADLTDDANLPFSTDIDGNTRPSGVTVSDGFDRSDGSVGSNWTALPYNYAGQIIGQTFHANNADDKATLMYWNANTFTNDQYSEFTLTADNDGNDHWPVVRASANGAYSLNNGMGWYGGVWQAVFWFSWYDGAGGGDNLGDPIDPVTAIHQGDVLRLEVQGTTLRFYINGVLTSSITDTRFASGAPGLRIWGAGDAEDNWKGGDLVPWDIGADEYSSITGKSFYDPFTFSDGRLGTQDTNWTEDVGSHSIVSNQLRMDTGSWGAAAAHYSGMALNGVDQYGKVTLTTMDTNAYQSIIFRFSTTSGKFYIVQANPSAYTYWARADTSGNEEENTTQTGITWSQGDIMAATIIGTGSNTVLRVWQNPTGNAPDTGGTTWGGVAPGITVTNPTYTVDSGNYMGVYGAQLSANTAKYDDFYGGDVPYAQGPPTGWNRSQKLTINHTRVPGDLTNFPVLITAAVLPDEMKTLGGSYAAQSDGGDIRFTSDAGGTIPLAAEIVGWTENATPGNATTEIWVKLPAVSSTTDTDFYVWYNARGRKTQPAANSTHGSQHVWDDGGSSHYKGVWHMPNGTTLSATDSLGVNDGTINNATATSGQIDGAANLNGTSANITRTSTTLDFTTYTVEEWAYAQDVSGERFLFEKRASTSTQNNYYLWYEPPNEDVCGTGDGNNLVFGFNNGSSFKDHCYATTLPTGSWHHYAVTLGGGYITLYIDGIAVKTETETDTPNTTGTQTFNIGSSGADDAYWSGKIDEVHASNSVRSANWIATEYANQNDPSTFFKAPAATAIYRSVAPGATGPVALGSGDIATQVVADNFNRGNSSDLGANWTNTGGNAYNQYTLLSNTAVPNSMTGWDSGSVYTGATFNADQYSQAKLTVVGTNGQGSGVGLLVRANTTTEDSYRFVIDHAGSNNWALARFDGDSYILLAQGTHAFSDGDTFYLSATGSNPVHLVVKHNGVILTTYDDSSGTRKTAGIPGIAFSTDETSSYTDDWEGGNVTVVVANTLSISGSTATFSEALPDNVGVGDAIQYDSDNNETVDALAFISGRTDSTHYTVQSASGGAPTVTSTGNTNWSIFRAYTSLANAVDHTYAGTENTGIDSSVRNFDTFTGSKDLVAANQVWNVALYANGTTADTATVDINDWTTGANNYLRIYTPTSTSEVGVSQRHAGKWDDTKYHMEVTSEGINVDTGLPFVKMEGLQIKVSGTSGTGFSPIDIIVRTTGSNRVDINNNILVGSFSGSVSSGSGIRIYSNDTFAYIYNNIIYGFINGSNGDLYGISSGGAASATGLAYVYNNTIYDSYFGMRANTDNGIIAKNNLIASSTRNMYGTFAAGTDYNATDDATMSDFYAVTGSGNSNDHTSHTFTFVDATNKDFHLASNDIGARNVGADLTSDTYLPFTTDIDGQTRPTGANTWDIGADQYVAGALTAIYRSVGPGATDALAVGSETTGSSLIVNDNFNRGDSSNLGVNWTQMTGAGGHFAISGNTAVPNPTGADSYSIYTGATFSADQYSQAKLSVTGTNGVAQGSALTVRSATASRDVYRFVIDHAGSSNWTLERFDSGSETDLTSGTQTFSDGDTFYLSATGSNPVELTVKINGNTLTTYSDSSSNRKTTGGPGISFSTDETSGSVDNWEGSDVIVGSEMSFDAFNRADANPIGGNWTAAGGGSPSLQVVSNGLKASTNSADNAAFWNANSFNADQYSEITVTNATSMDGGPAVRVSGSSKTYYTLWSGSGSYWLAYCKNGSCGSFEQVMYGSVPTTGDIIRLQVVGNTLTAFRNGVQIGDSYTDTSSPITNGSSGVYQYNTTTVFDDWEGGSLSSGSGGATNALNISGTTATFATALPDNVGVGDVLLYDSNNDGTAETTAYISGRTDSTHYTIQQDDGSAPIIPTSSDEIHWQIHRAYTSLADAVADSQNLVSANQQWNIALYANGTTADTNISINGWTTSADNYLRIYTPYLSSEVGISQRHSGKWDTSKYHIEGTSIFAFENYANYIKIDGLQIKEIFATTPGYNVRAMLLRQTGTSSVSVSNNIIVGSSVTGTGTGTGIEMFDGSDVLIWNNIVYGFNIAGSYGIVCEAINSCSIYNNTVYNSTTGIYRYSATPTVIVKNNISYNNSTTDYSGTFNSASTNNLSKDSTAPALNTYYTGKTLSFVSTTPGSEDFHLVSGDTDAIGKGADLSEIFTTDIDGQTRTVPWDIGADKYVVSGPTAIYRSVGPNNTSALATGGSNAMTISGTTATFASGLPDNVGVGDVIQYKATGTGAVDSLAFISGRNSSTSYSVQNVSGGIPSSSSSNTGWSIFRAYTKLANAVSNHWTDGGTENTGIDAGLRDFDTWSGGKNIASSNEQWNIALYADAQDVGYDHTVDLSGWTTTPLNYLRIYTPYLPSEVGISQRHSGKWDNSKYILGADTSFSNTIYSTANINVRLEGLQIDSDGSTISPIIINPVLPDTLGTQVYIDNNIIRNNGSIESGAIYMDSNQSNSYFRIYNNIIYGFNHTSTSKGMDLSAIGSIFYVYNNTIVDVGRGIRQYNSNGTIFAKNNIVQNCATACFEGTGFDASSDYNISSDGTAMGANSKISTTVSFADAPGKDFHLASDDTSAKGAGEDLHADLYLPFNTDIDGQTRSVWDIGADEYVAGAPTAIYRSVGPSDTSNLNTSNNTVTISGTTATFSDTMPDNIGVGDVLEYPASSPTYVAFISGRTSSTVYTVQSASGGTPQSATAGTAVHVHRAYTSLANAESGTQNTSITPTFIGGNQDLVANNEQWNIALYANGTTADTNTAIVQGWTTGPSNYLRIYTATSTSEVGVSQRHAGKWDNSKYWLSVTGNDALGISDDYVRVDGMQVQVICANNNWCEPITLNHTGLAGENWVSNNIVRGTYSGTSDAFNGILAGWAGSGSQRTAKIWNNIVYNIRNGSMTSIYGIEVGTPLWDAYIYNNTVYNSYYGIYSQSNTILKNNISYNNAYDYGGNFNALNTNNLSKDGTAPGLNAKTSKTLTFVSTTADSEDFHLSVSDIDAIDKGADLSADTYLPFSTDIDGQTRTAPWDIGADEYVFTAPIVTFTQSSYGWYTNANSLTPGSALAPQNFSLMYSNYSTPVRLRINVSPSGALSANAVAFKLQWSNYSNGTWTDVGAVGATSGWRFAHNSSVTDGTQIPSTSLSDSNIVGVYRESNTSALNPLSVQANQKIEYDFALDPSVLTFGQVYYLRLVNFDGTPFGTYSNIPTVTIRASAFVSGGAMMAPVEVSAGGGTPVTGGTGTGGGLGGGTGNGGGTPVGGGTSEGGGLGGAGAP